jgi:hypothetical protein
VFPLMCLCMCMCMCVCVCMCVYVYVCVRLGDEVGYCVRFDDNTSTNTRVKFMTDGILVRECLSDPKLTRYQAVMLDVSRAYLA